MEPSRRRRPPRGRSSQSSSLSARGDVWVGRAGFEGGKIARRLMSAPASELSDTSSSVSQASNGRVLRRLFRFAWQYRHDCLAVLSYQGVLLALGLAGLGAVGLAVDTI